jgi:hypothetical protein
LDFYALARNVPRGERILHISEIYIIHHSGDYIRISQGRNNEYQKKEDEASGASRGKIAVEEARERQKRTPPLSSPLPPFSYSPNNTKHKTQPPNQHS